LRDFNISTKFNVISIGAALIDIIANVERFPLNDDEVFVPDLKIMCGGAAANTAVACAKLGLKTAFLGKIGDNDEFGKIIIRGFKNIGVDISLLKYSKEFGTGSCFVVLNKAGDRRLYAYSGAANVLEAKDIMEEEIKQSKIIYLSSLKNINPFIKAAKLAQKNDIPVVLNPGMLIIEQGLEKIKPLLNFIDVFIFSFKEFTSLLSIEDSDLTLEELKEKLKDLFSLGIRVIVVTMGSRGSSLFVSDNDENILVPSSKVEVIDTTGAGDAFSAGFLYSFSKTLSYNINDLKEHLNVGNLVASKCIQKIGARNGLPTIEDLNL